MKQQHRRWWWRIARSRGKKRVAPPPPPPPGCERAMGMARKCCVLGCGSELREARAKGLPLHKFPKEAALRSRWLQSGGFPREFKPTPGLVVCHRHFKRADYDEVVPAKGHQNGGGSGKLLLRKGSVPSVFADYDNHPDPVVMSVKSSTSYAQEDLDLINSEILNLEHSASPLISGEARTPKSDSCGETYSRPESSADSYNVLETTEPTDNGCKTMTMKEETMPSSKEESVDSTEMKVNTMAVQLGIVESEVAMKNVTKDLLIKDELKSIKVADGKEFDKPEELKPKMLNRGGLKFFPGAKLEAKDFNEKWYSAKVVETDWDEREVLIHFDKWSSRFDEWIPMDSSRLRVLQAQPNEQTWENLPSLRQPERGPCNVPSLSTREPKMRDFSVGERILATWADGRKYPAKVNAVLGNDRYDVLFDDGYAKTVKSSKMTKIAATPAKQQPAQTEEYIGSKQERRDKKRKHTVMELFHTHSRKRSKHETEKPAKKEGLVVGHENGDCFLDARVDLDGTMFGPCYDPGTDLLKGFDPNVPKMKQLPKKGGGAAAIAATTTNATKKELPKNIDTDQEEDVGPEWIDGEPQGTEAYIVDGSDGPRRSIIVADKRLPPGWQKHFTQRKAGTSAGKWDVLFIHKSSGKKFRSRNDIRAFMETQGQFDFDPERFDFCIHRKKRNNVQKVKQDGGAEPQKKIKTLLPKTKAPPAQETTLLMPSTIATPSVPAVSTSTAPMTDAVFIGGLRVEMEDSAYKCPKEGCNKNFRKENLLQMHIKHYHPEYSKFLGSTPNVADLAYARTIGEPIDDIIPKKSNIFLDKFNKFGKKKFTQDNKPSTVSQSVATSVPTASPSTPMITETEDEMDQIEKSNDPQKDETKMDTMSPISSHSIDMDEDIEKKRENACAMSPGTLFDLKVREERTQSGIKTLLPVRPATTSSETPRPDRSKSLDETAHNDRGKGPRKRQLSEYGSDLASKAKKRHGVPEIMDDYGDMDESAVDAEGPTALMYRYSRRKSDSKSDENSQNSQLNDSRLDKGDPLKGDATKRDNNIDGEESEGVMMMMINGEMVKVEQLRREEIINCTCGFMEEDGLMIQCDLCLCWQHGHCNAIEREKDVPEKYICYICQHPYRQRPSKKYYHDQDWMKEGKLLSIPNRSKNQAVINQRTAMLKRSYDLVAALLQIQQVLHSLRVKINVAQKKDHPKLYLWAKNWEKIEVPKPDLTPVPVMEITKSVPEATDNATETVRRVELKSEAKLSLKEDPDEKSIASDSELMKILEEDSTTSDESRVACKKEDQAGQNNSHILLDALTKNDESEEKQLGLVPKVEDTGDLLANQTDIAETQAAVMVETKKEEPSEISAPLQPCIPEPEAPIDPGECRMRLLEHIEHFQSHIDSKLTSIEAQVCALEAMDPEDLVPSPDVQPRTKQTVQMLLRDLNTVRKLAALC